jgi:hypothetical protein
MSCGCLFLLSFLLFLVVVVFAEDEVVRYLNAAGHPLAGKTISMKALITIDEEGEDIEYSGSIKVQQIQRGRLTLGCMYVEVGKLLLRFQM